MCPNSERAAILKKIKGRSHDIALREMLFKSLVGL